MLGFPRPLRGLGAAEHGRWQSAKTAMLSQKDFQDVSRGIEVRGLVLALPLQGSATALTRSQHIATLGVAADSSSRLIANKALQSDAPAALRRRGFPHTLRSFGAAERRRWAS